VDETRGLQGNALILKSCIICGRPSPTSRCPLHPKPPKRTGSYGRDAAKVRANANLCHICLKPFTDPNDPPVADHVLPRAYGGTDDITNPKAAHRSCNGRKGATLPSR
jgi:5-methylcytosine-specific restriction endonuclease McrA